MGGGVASTSFATDALEFEQILNRKIESPDSCHSSVPTSPAADAVYPHGMNKFLSKNAFAAAPALYRNGSNRSNGKILFLNICL